MLQYIIPLFYQSMYINVEIDDNQFQSIYMYRALQQLDNKVEDCLFENRKQSSPKTPPQTHTCSYLLFHLE